MKCLKDFFQREITLPDIRSVHQNWRWSLFILTGFWTCISHAQPFISLDSTPICFEIESRVRNGNAGFEGALFTPSTPPPGQPGGGQWQMNPAGAPVWNSNGNQYGDVHSFEFTYTKATGTSVWKIDFNRDLDYTDPAEMVSNVAPTLIGRSFTYINIWGQGSNAGMTASLMNLNINGVPFGNYSSSSSTPFSELFEDVDGLFGNITVTGDFSFSGGESQEIPRIWVRLAKANEFPSCVISAPLDSAIVNNIDSFYIETITSDPDGNVIQVDFYADNILIAQDSLPPYVFLWDIASVGYHTLTAKATDNLGAMKLSVPVVVYVNSLPTCEITVPLDSAYYYIGDTVFISAMANDTDGTLDVVEFFADSMLIGIDSFAPYAVIWPSPPAGNYVLTARATDDLGGSTVSPLVHIVVNGPPTCTLIEPAMDSMLYYDPAILTLQVLATDPNDQVSEVEFYVDSVLVGSDTTSPFEWSIVNPSLGTYTVYAKAYDTYGVVTVSTVFHYTIRCIREDLDNNGIVNTIDFLLFLSVFGDNCPVSCPADFNDDGVVNTTDYLHLLSAIGYMCN